KVDREERPDIDHFYMTVCQMMTGTGGWPLTIIMTPDKKPFFAATYIPPNSRFGMMGMMELIPRIKNAWENQESLIRESTGEILSHVQNLEKSRSRGELDETIFHNAARFFKNSFDHEYGGFGSHPKFPSPHNLRFLLRYWKRTSDDKAIEMVEQTLSCMRKGGVFDHVGFGFHRYSTDNRWLVPHFEKMLYDQALLAMAYLETYQATGKKEYAQTAREIFTYIARDMTSPGGGFYSAEDADSEGVEGKFYLWMESEIRNILDSEEADLAVRIFRAQKDGNFRDEATGTPQGKNILHLEKPISDSASELHIPEKELASKVESIRQKLFTEREKRIPPLKDDKILTDWNGLMIAALSLGARILDESPFANAAKKAADFILDQMKTPEGRLLHRFRDGESALTGFLTDYAFLAWGLLEIYESTFDVYYLKEAISLIQKTLDHFLCGESGGFFLTPNDVDDIPVRQKEAYDGAVPSGNSIMALNLLRLFRITGKIDYEDISLRLFRAFAEQVMESPTAFTQLLIALDFALGPSTEAVVAGKINEDDTKGMLRILRREFQPCLTVLFHPADERQTEIWDIADFTRNQIAINGKATAYICRNRVCKKPATNPRELLDRLQE
ncbi:thioredoxin domain-containing protein, partial [Candidatus Sumerlaeota bacterium]|nr:thioredoxin domain-containing protein [Candidatus Sumerlaeota bacterium]